MALLETYILKIAGSLSWKGGITPLHPGIRNGVGGWAMSTRWIKQNEKAWHDLSLPQ